MPKPRGKSNKPLKPVLHIFCEGEKTEPNYLNGYLNEFYPSNRRLKVIKVEKSKKNTPVQLIEEAKELKQDKNTYSFDSFWVVYDREAITKYSNNLHQQAYELAKSKGIEVAISNVCFEIWILLHFIDVSAQYSSCDDLLRNSPLKNKLKENGIDEYDKADAAIFNILTSSIQDARIRAERMNQTTIDSSYDDSRKPYLLNPYTNMHKLLDAIDEFIRN